MDPAPIDAGDLFRALGLPREGALAFLAHIEAFCLAHGGAPRYAELMALVQKYRSAQDA